MGESEIDFAIYFNSGMNSRTNTYTNGANVTHIQINNSDQTYYQDGFVELYDCSTQNVGDNVDVYINDSREFSGYVSRRQIVHKSGKNLYSYQLIGKTYDLWRYRTGENTSYIGYSGFIASSLVHDYCTNIHGNSNITDGWNFESSIDLSDQTVGDALVTLIGHDGFKFYVDNNNDLVYYDPTAEETPIITVEEDDIIDMSPIEEADEDLTNDILVIGTNAYYSKTSIPLPAGKAIANVSSGIFKRNMYVAQRVKGEEDTLSAIRMFLSKTSDPSIPENNIQFEIWDNTTQQIFNDDFDTGMTNWSVTSNTMFEDGYLKLKSIGSDINQLTDNLTTNINYQGQVFTPFITATIDSAIVKCYHNYGVDKTLWVEIRETTGSPLQYPTSVVLSSGSVKLQDSVSYDTLVPVKPKVTLSSGTQYAVIIHLNPVEKLSGRQILADVCSGYRVYSSDNITWYPSISRDMYFWVRLAEYVKNGYALSKPFGTPTKRIYDQYMKVDIDGLTSSNRIYISGSNSGSKNFRTLMDEQWYNFGFENKFSSQVKIWLSGNGTYTPKIDSIIASISDFTGGPDATLLTDNFDNYTYLSGATRKKVLVDNGILAMSGSKGVPPNPNSTGRWISGSMVGGCTTSRYINPTYGSDLNNSSYCSTDPFPGGGTAGNWSVKITLPNYKDLSKSKFIAENSWYSSRYLDVRSIWISGNWVGKGFLRCFNGIQKITNLGYKTTTEIPFDAKYYDIKKINISGYQYQDLSYGNHIYEIDFYQENRTTYSGSIQTKDYNIGTPLTYLNIVPTNEIYPNKITYSGSKNSGSTWYKLTKNTWTVLGAGGASGQHIKFMYNFKPSTLTTTNTFPYISTQYLKNASPSIDSIVLRYSTIQGGNLPKSGTKIEYSDDIYIQPGDIAYPPSYSAYQLYTPPKLKDDGGGDFNINNYYWIIVYGYSGLTDGTKYWKYYYDQNSTYTDGIIAYSTGNSNLGKTGVGVLWKNYALKPAWVPPGSLIMDIGWKDKQVRATAINEQSINKYGRHQKIITDSMIDSFTLASSMANEMVAGMENIPRKGTVTIDGIEGIKTTYKLSSNLVNLGIGGEWEIVAFTQNLDSSGFTTILTYGKQPFNIAKRIADLEKKVF